MNIVKKKLILGFIIFCACIFMNIKFNICNIYAFDDVKHIIDTDWVGQKVLEVDETQQDDCFIKEIVVSKGTDGVVDYGTYRLYQPDNYEKKPLMIVIPGAAGQIDGSFHKVGIYDYVANGDIKPDFTIIFFYRQGGYRSVGYENVRNTISKYDYNSKLYYCGVSMGANEFPGYCKQFDFAGAILVDGRGEDFKDETTLEKVVVVQSTQRRFSEYKETLQYIELNRVSNGFDSKYDYYSVIDLTESPSHDDSPWWVFAPNDDTYFKYRRHNFKRETPNILELFNR